MLIEFNLYEIRTNKQLSIRELAKLSGVSKSQINNLENNKCDPKLSTIFKLARALEVKPEELFIFHK